MHPVVQVLFPNKYAIFQDESSPYTQPEVLSWLEEHEDALRHLLWLAKSPNVNIIETLVSFRDQGQKQIPSIIPPATRRNVVQYSNRDCSELTLV